MNKEDVIKKIVFECTAKDGFLFELRAGKFQSQQFRELLSALKEYREYVRNNDLIDRAVAFCVIALDNALVYAEDRFPKNTNEANEISNALASAPIIDEILSPEWMISPLPEEYKFLDDL